MSAIEIPGYKIIRTLGVGGQATVYLAIQQGFDREVALKVMSPALAADPTFGERFIREAKIVAKLSHKSIVTVYDVGESGSFYYLAMEYMPGKDLKNRIVKGMKTRECLIIIAKLAKALHFAHQKGYIHRDVKSENILFDNDGEPVLTDFGIAKASNSSTQMTQTGKLIGTPEYMSPEQCRGKTVDGRSDLYSLGIILFEMLTRQVPYRGEDSVAVCIQHVTKPLPSLPVRLNRFQWLLELLLAKDPIKRFQTGEQLAVAVLNFEKTGQSQTFEKDKGIHVKAEHKSTKTELNVWDEEPEDFDDLHTEQRFQQQNAPKKSQLPLIISILIVCIVGIGGFLTKDQWYEQAYQLMIGVNEQIGVKSAENLNKNKTTSSKTNGLPLQAQSKTELATPSIDEILQEADALVQFVPHHIHDIKKALKLISTVNTLELGNKNAQLIYQNILSVSLTEATLQAEKNNFEMANEWLALVQFEEPKYTLLEATKSNVAKLKSKYDLKEKNKNIQQLKIKKLLTKGNLALKEKRFFSPQNNHAVDYYQQILQIEPENIEAKKKLKIIESLYHKLIEKAVDKKSFTKAKAMLFYFSSLSEEQSKINLLRQAIITKEKQHLTKIEKRKKQTAIAKKVKKAELDRLEKLNDPIIQMKLLGSLDSAKNLEQQEVFVMPEENNAIAKYKVVLSLDNQNEEAKAGIKRIEKKIKNRLTKLINLGDRKNANVWLTKFRLYQDNHPEYESFKIMVDEMIETNEIVESLPVEHVNKNSHNNEELQPVEQESSQNKIIDKEPLSNNNELSEENKNKEKSKDNEENIDSVD